MSTLRVTNLKGGSAGSAPNLPDGAVITGVATVGVISATTIYGSGANLTGIDATALKDSGGTVKIQANSTGAVVTGVLTATTGSFTSNVSVGGTLTYEDVTNVDSVGLITARGGINISGSDLKVGAAFTVGQAGVVTATSFIGSGANLTNLPPGGNIISGIASGSLAADKAVALAHDGKVFQFNAPIGGKDPFTKVGGDAYITSAAVQMLNGTYVPTVDRSVIFCRQGSLPRWHLLNGTSGVSVNNDYITNSDPGSGIGKRMASCWDPDNSRIFVAWSDTTNSDRGYCCVGTVSASSISWGTPVVFETSRVDYLDVVYDTTQNRVVLVYQKSEGVGRAIVGTIANTGNTIAFGTAVDVNDTNGARNLHCTHDVNANKILITYENSGNSQRAAGRLATVANTGNSITMVGSVTELNQATGMDSYSDLAYDPDNQKSLWVYKGSAHYGYAKVLSISGTTISAGAEATFYGASMATTTPNLEYDTGSNAFVLSYVKPGASNIPVARPANISGTSVTFGTELQTWNGSSFSPISVINPTANKAIYAFVRNDNSHPMRQVIRIAAAQPNISNSGQYIGFPDQAYTDGQTATIKTVGNTVSSLSGLTTTSKYYVQADGTVALTWDSTTFTSFATNTPRAGRAINSTTLQIYEPDVASN